MQACKPLLRCLDLALALAAGASGTALARERPVQSYAQSLAEDAAPYAAQFGVTTAQAARRLRVQQASVATTDVIAREFAARLAGISIEHRPDYRISVLLTGSEEVATRTLTIAGTAVPVVFRTGAKATHAEAIEALRKHLIDFRSELPAARGAGYDQRTGEVVLLVTGADAQRLGTDAIRRRSEQVSGVPVRVVINDLLESNMALAGGGRVSGRDSTTGIQNLCTTGFVVTDGTRRAITTAAHCADDLTYRDPVGGDTPLAFGGQWGLGYHDVQINHTSVPLQPRFYADRRAGSLRPLTSWRNRASTRAGDFVCHWGESSGYSCAEVQLTDYAPPGALCGGPCSPTWVTVAGPTCRPGDSGGPVFSGTVAFGIAKGVNRSRAGQCNFYYYMSTDFLPPPWRLEVAR
jgi:hypothetical protein